MTETPVEGGSQFTFDWWAPLGATLVGVLGLVAAVPLFRRRWWRFALIALAVGVIGLLIGPGLFLDKAVVTDERFELHSGLWFMPNRHNFRWDEVAALEGVAEEKTGRRGRKSTSFSLVVTRKTGGRETVPVGDLMKRGPLAKLLEVADARDIPISGVGPAME